MCLTGVAIVLGRHSHTVRLAHIDNVPRPVLSARRFTMAAKECPLLERSAVPTHPTSSSKQTLKMGIDEIWCEASAKASEGEKAAAMPFVRALKLQHELIAQIEEEELQKLMNECRPFQKTILAELNHAAQSGPWLLALPSEPSYRLKDDEYRMAVRKRLGLLPEHSLVDESCLACHGRNTELPQLKCDPHHAKACVPQTATRLLSVTMELLAW
jgi:hypothetical protein